VRHLGTIGVSLAHGDPASDLPAVLLALDGEVDVVGSDGKRTIPAADFFRGVFETAAGPTEIVTEVRVPKLTGAHGWSFLKFRRRAQDWATVGVAVVVKRRNGGAESAAISLVNMGATPLRPARPRRRSARATIPVQSPATERTPPATPTAAPTTGGTSPVSSYAGRSRRRCVRQGGGAGRRGSRGRRAGSPRPRLVPAQGR